jgi:phosphonoacetaldehyde hydrolase
MKLYTGAIQAVVFDWAGTTVDYGCFAPIAVFMQVFQQQSVTISMDQARAPMGLEKRDHIRAISQQPDVRQMWEEVHGKPCSEVDIEAMYMASVEIQKAIVSDYADLIPGTLETAFYCREHQIRIGSSTGYSRPIMDVLVPAAARLGYSPDAVFCPSDVPQGRPAPYMMYRNAIALHVYPMSAIVKVGDTIPDIEEGLQAGAWTVGLSQSGNELGLSLEEVTNLDPFLLYHRLEIIEKKMKQAGAHYVIPTIADLPAVLDQIQNRLRNGDRP